MYRSLLTGIFTLLLIVATAQTKGNLSISTTGSTNLKINFNGYKYSLQDRTATFQTLTPGSYPLLIYQWQTKNGTGQYEKVYDGNIRITAGRHLEITVMRFGKTAWDEANIESDSWNEYYINPPVSENNQSTNTINTSSWEQMTAGRFATLKEQVQKEFGNATQLAVAKVGIKNSWVTTQQIKELCEIFFGDDTKLQLAKYAYDYCSDKNNYLNLMDVFFSGTVKTSLLDYINSR